MLNLLLMGYNPDDAFLIVEFRNGKQKAFNKIFFRYHGSILYFARELMGETEAAKDLASDVFMKAWNRRADFESVKALKAFLYTAAKNGCITHLRHSKVVLEHQKQEMHEQTGYQVENMALQRMFDAEVLRELSNAINALTPQCKRLVRLFLKEGVTTDDVATLMNLAPQSVRNTKVRARNALKLELAKRGLPHTVVALLAGFI